MKINAGVLALLPFIVSAQSTTPTKSATGSASFCSARSSFISKLGRESGFHAFCSSYLHIKAKTTTILTTKTAKEVKATFTVTLRKTTTTTSRVTTFSTISSTLTTTITPDPSTSTSTITVPGFAVTVTCASTGTILGEPETTTSTTFAKQKREYCSPTPASLHGKPAKTISAVCSCLNLTTSTKRVTHTVTLRPKTSTGTRSTTISVSKTTTITTLTVFTVTPTSTELASRLTFTTTSTTTYNPTFVANANGGVKYHLREVPNPDNIITGTFNNFNSDQFKEGDYTYTGLIRGPSSVFTALDTTCSLPGYGTVPCGPLGGVFQGFYYSTFGGPVSFSTGLAVDNSEGIWSGNNSYSAWNKANIDAFVTFPYNTPSVFTVNTQPGQFVPITVVWINYGGGGRADLLVSSSDTLFQYQDAGAFMVPPCDGSPFVPGDVVATRV